MRLFDVTFQAVSEKHPDFYREWIVKEGAGLCVSPGSYENLAKNMAEVKRYIIQIHSLLTAYEQERASANAQTVEGAEDGNKETTGK